MSRATIPSSTLTPRATTTTSSTTHAAPRATGCATSSARWKANAAPAAGLGEGEVFSDVGLDGVAETPQLQDGGYDSGEGDGCWTMARGMQRMLETNPRTFVMNADIEVLRNLDYFGDGGIRDLFGFGSNQDQLAGALAARGLPVSLFNGHSALAHDGRLEDQALAELDIHWRDVGKYVQLRYGHIDASEEQLIAGDGGHVGTTTQIINRLLSVMSWMSARWPEGDRAAVRDRICVRLGNGCDHINQIGLEFTSSLGRTGPVSIVLPPGYFDEENADATYPVIYLLHGYGMTPEDLLPSGLIIWTLMTSTMIPEPERLQKMIFVFPDGRCRDDECVRGTFYANAPSSHPQGPQMETFLLDLMDYMDANYRTRAPQTHTIAE